MVRIIRGIAHGDLSELQELQRIGRRSDKDELLPSVISTMESLNTLVTDMNLLSRAAVAGRLSERANTGRHQGEYRKIVEGVNATLDAVVSPLNEAADSVRAIGRGEIPPRITASYQGDFDTLKNSINASIDGLGGLVEANTVLQRMAVNDYTRRIEGSHVGIFDQVKRAVTEVQDRVRDVVRINGNLSRGSLEDLPSLKQVGRCSDQDQLIPSLIHTMEALSLLTRDVNLLSRAAIEGRLTVRAQAELHRGEFRSIVVGINQTLDALWAPIEEAVGSMERLAERDVTAEIRGDYSGDHAKLKTAFNHAAANLRDALQQVAQGSEQVSSASHEIASGSQSLADGASQQAGALEEVSSSLQEMASRTGQNALHALEAKAVSENARTACDRGVETTQRLTASMEQIKASSHATARIIKTIDEIAFQTNLLALNAAVEAARAGDAGRGFAVVAEEVRNLAMRSAEAARNTTSLIEESVNNADSGVAINQEVLRDLELINTEVHKVSEVMAEIALASEQQKLGVEQITEAVSTMNALTQQVAANAEESASAAEELSAQAAEMQGLVASFDIGTGVAQAQSSTSRGVRLQMRPNRSRV